MREFINGNMELMNTLHSISNGPMTTFLISDAAVNNLNPDARLYLRTNTDLLLQVNENNECLLCLLLHIF